LLHPVCHVLDFVSVGLSRLVDGTPPTRAIVVQPSSGDRALAGIATDRRGFCFAARLLEALEPLFTRGFLRLDLARFIDKAGASADEIADAVVAEIWALRRTRTRSARTTRSGSPS
jgi:hypothetical protein